MAKKKVDPMSAKALSNRMKSKGLMKLKFYCQMCQKQCRDENGFKCHIMSEAHQRQLLIFAEAPSKFLDQFSSEFFGGFMRVLKNQFGTTRVNANRVYQEYIRDREHVHMNGTKWLSLGGFVRWLGARGHCEIEETPKGWFITYIDKDPETLRRQHALKAREKLDQDDQERMEKFLAKQIERNLHNRVEKTPTFTEFSRKSSEGAIKFSLKKKETNETNIMHQEPQEMDDSIDDNTTLKPAVVCQEEKKTKSNLETLILDKFVGKRKRMDHWIVPNLVVKIITESLGKEFYRKKAVINDVIDKYTAVVQLLDDSSVKMKLDQTHLETVIPAIGKPVRIVNGEYRDEYGKLLEVDTKEFTVRIELISSIFKGQLIDHVSIEDVCKCSTL